MGLSFFILSKKALPERVFASTGLMLMAFTRTIQLRHPLC